MVSGCKMSPIDMENIQKPSNYGPLDSYEGHARITGPCGDTMEFWLRIDKDHIVDASFVTDGCSDSVVCGSMTAELAEGKSVEQAAQIEQKDVLESISDLPVESEHCALLSANTLRAACLDAMSSKRPAAPSTNGCAETCSSCTGKASEQQHGEKGAQQTEELERLRHRLGHIAHKVVVLSGKGGVGKSTVAVNTAVALSLTGKRVGLLDIDIHGPSVPKMLSLEGVPLRSGAAGISPVEVDGMKVMSIGFLLHNRDDAVIWRGPMKYHFIKQFLSDVDWGELDFLVIDSPPGTGDEPLAVCQLIENADGAFIVTTPQNVATADVRRSIGFCRQLKLPVIGVVENMSGFVCPKCGEVTQIFTSGGGERMAEETGVPFLGRIPIDPSISEACDNGMPYVRHFAGTETSKAFQKVISPILAGLPGDVASDQIVKKEGTLRIAVPVSNGKLSMHFGHCEMFALIDVDPSTKAVMKKETIEAPDHQPGLLPRWLAERGADVILAGGMGSRAQGLFAENGIKVLVGAPCDTPERLVAQYLEGSLQSGQNVCDH